MDAFLPDCWKALTIVLAAGLAHAMPARAEEAPVGSLPRYVPSAEELRAGYELAQRTNQPRPRVYKDRIAPHWFEGNKFWYRNDLPAGKKEFIAVDPATGKREPAFDHARLAAALSKATGKSYEPDRLPFDSMEYKKQTIQVAIDGVIWQLDRGSYECKRKEESGKSATPGSADAAAPAPQPRPPRRQHETPPSPRSPDGKWTAFIKDHNLFVRAQQDGKEIQLTTDGTADLAYAGPHWSPDSQRLAAFRVEQGDHKEVYLIESSPSDGGRARLRKRPYDLPGDKLTSYELNLFAVDGARRIKPQVERIEVGHPDFGFPNLRWSKDCSRVYYEKVDRGHQRYRLMEVDARTGEARALIDERSQTFIWTAHTESVGVPRLSWLERTPEIIYASERDGWRHLYLIDAATGKVKNQITRGDWVVRGIDWIDEDRRQIWFQASGMAKEQDPYFIHHYRIDFDGTHLVALTEGNGTHTVQYSPDHQYLIDTYSRVAAAPVHELRRTAAGKLLCILEQADITELKQSGWKPPEVFAAKGRDGKTDIWGIICRPRKFDPGRKYPVIESIYAGPQGSFVPKAFMAFNRYAALTELGFIVVQIDGMGTANRSKAFHDVCWHNLKDAGFPDRILWHQAVAKKYPYYDISRVGIYGTSAGGQNAAGAVLFHPEFYKAAVASCGCHDNRMDKASWNEQWMGYPIGPQYAECSNVTHAANLRGKLLLIVGEMDTNVPPESTYRFVDALIKARKDFEFVAIPGMGHSNGGAYGVRRMQDFFVRHLHGVEPPDHNGGAKVVAGASQASAQSTDTLVPTLPAGAKGTAPPGLNGPGRDTERPHVGSRTVHGDQKGTPGLSPVQVTTPPESFFEKVRERDRDAARKFYKKYLDINGMPIAASAEVADEALRRTHYLVTHLLAGRPDILQAMVKNGTRLIIIGKDQVYTDMPEYRNHPNPSFQNERVRGTGGFDITSFGEENLLNLPLDRYDDESIAVHEFCHTIDAALGRIDPGWRERLVKTYRSAMSQGLWKNAYTASNPAEYWAEICQSYFDCNRINNWNHAAIGTREQLRQYDPEGHELVRTTFNLTPANDWRYKPLRRQPSVTPPPEKFKVNPYYTKFTYAREFTVLGSQHASDEALLRANDIIRKMFAYRHDILKALINDGARLVVLGRSEKLSDLPEFKDSRKQAGFDEVRYLDYTPSLKLMVVPEENVLGLPGDPFAGKCMVISVFARGLYQVVGLRPVDPDFDKRRGKQQYELRVKRLDVEFDHRLQKLHDEATGKGLWKGTPAARSRVEYWAAGVEAYFDAAGSGYPPTGADRPITTREALKAYDPGLFTLVDETMAYREHVDWRYRRSGNSGK